MKKILSFIAVCVTAVAVSAEVIDLQTPGAWQKNSALTAKDGILTVTGKQQLLTAEQITIDHAKTYTFTATMRCVDGKKSAFMPIVLQYDAAKKSKVLSYYYGSDGKTPVKLQDIKDYYNVHNALIKTATILKVDSKTNETLSKEDLEKAKQKAESKAHWMCT